VSFLAGAARVGWFIEQPARAVSRKVLKLGGDAQGVVAGAPRRRCNESPGGSVASNGRFAAYAFDAKAAGE